MIFKQNCNLNQMYNDIDDIPIPFYKRDNIYIIVEYLL